MTFSKLEAPLSVKFLEEGSASGYPMIIAKVFEGTFEGARGGFKLEVSKNGSDR